MPRESSGKQKQPIKIKEVIETFCLLFHCHGYPKISAEVLRQSKFDQKEPVIPLLEFTFELLTKDIGLDTLDWSNSRKFMLLLYVLKCLSYPRLHLLYCKELVFLSSQELLLALGFLLIKFDVIGMLCGVAENLITDRILDTCLSTPTTKGSLEKSVCLKTLDGQVRASKIVGFHQNDLLSNAMHLEKLLRRFESMDKSEVGEGLRGRGENKYQGTQSDPKDSLSKGKTQSSPSRSTSKINVLDVIFFGNLRLQESCIELLRKQVELLRIHLKWSQHESLFWKWLSSSATTVKRQGRGTDHTDEKERLEYQVFCPGHNGDSHSILEALDSGANLNHFVRQVMRGVLLRNDIVFSSSKDSNGNAEEGLTYSQRNALLNLRKSIVKVEEENKKWLEHFLSNNFPNVVQLPELKK